MELEKDTRDGKSITPKKKDLLSLSREICGGCFLKVNLVNLNLPIYEFITIDDNAQTINVHENKTWVNIIGDALEGTCGRAWIYDNATLMFVSYEPMGMTYHKDVTTRKKAFSSGH